MAVIWFRARRQRITVDRHISIHLKCSHLSHKSQAMAFWSFLQGFSHTAHGNFTGIVNCLYLQLTHYTIMKFHSYHNKFYSACKSAKNFTPNTFQFISILSWNRSSVFFILYHVFLCYFYRSIPNICILYIRMIL